MNNGQGTSRNDLGILATLMAVIGWLMVAGTAFASAELIVSAAGENPEADLTVTLVAADGTRQQVADDDGDGVLIVTPDSGPGVYELMLTLGNDQGTRTLEVPESGQIHLVFAPRGSGEKIRVTYSGANERILVTARRRQEDIQATPISITAFSAVALEERSVRDLSDVGDFTPNMDFSNAGVLGGSSSEATVYIRGIGQIANNLFNDPGVGIYVDGVYLARTQGAVLDLLDLERAEILRGPQGTLFGKNTIGGAINLITRKPDSGRGGYVELAAGNFDRFDGRLRLNYPFSDKAFGSLAFSSASASGLTESLATGEDYYDDDRTSGRLALRFLPRDDITVDWTADFTRERERAVDISLLSLDNTVPILSFYNQVTASVGFPTFDEQFITGDLHQSFSDDPNFSNGDVAGTALTVGWNAGAVELRSITSYRDLEYDLSNDLDGTPVRYAFRPTLTTQEQLTQELQLLGVAADDRLDWVVGALYFAEESQESSHGELFGGLFEALEAAPGPIFAPPGVPNFLCDPGPPPPGLPCFGGAGNPFNLGFFIDPDQRGLDDLTTDSYAVFGEVTYAASDRLSLTFGLRYTDESKDYILREIPGPTGIAPPLTLFNEDSWDALTPRFSVGFQARPDFFVYGTIANGFKSGGFNGLRGGSTATLLEPFDPEEVWAYEVGFKSDLLDDRLRLNGAGFFNDYTDLQLTASLNIGGEPATVIQNAGQSEIYGFELEMVAQPSNQFEISASVGYTHAEYTDLDDTVQAVTLDGTIPKTPEWTLAISPQYTIQQDDGGAFILRADYSYRSKFFNDVANNETVAQGAYGLINARVSYLMPSGSWELSLFGTNLADEEYLEHGLFPAAFGPAIGTAGRPREWGASARYRF